MQLSYAEQIKVEENFDVYDLVEALDLSTQDIIEAFDDKIVDNKDVMRKIGSI